MDKEALINSLNAYKWFKTNALKLPKATIIDLIDKGDEQLTKDRAKVVDFCNSWSKSDDKYFYDMLISLQFIYVNDPKVIAYTSPDGIITLNYPSPNMAPMDDDRWRRWYFIYCHECMHQIWNTFAVEEKIKNAKIPFNHDILNIASDCVINDYLANIKKYNKIPPIGGIFPDFIKKTFGVDYDRKYDTQFSLYCKIMQTDKAKMAERISNCKKLQPKDIQEIDIPDTGNMGGDKHSPDYIKGWTEGIVDATSGNVDPKTFKPLPNDNDYNKGYNDVMEEIKSGLEEGLAMPKKPSSSGGSSDLPEIPWDLPKNDNQNDSGSDNQNNSSSDDKNDSNSNSKNDCNSESSDGNNSDSSDSKNTEGEEKDSSKDNANNMDSSVDNSKSKNNADKAKDAADKAKDAAETAKNAAETAKNAAKSGKPITENAATNAAKNAASEAESAAKSAKDLADKAELDAKDGKCSNEDAVKARKAADEARKAADEAKEIAEKLNKSESAESKKASKAEMDAIRKEISEKTKEIVKKYSEKAASGIGDFLRKCKASKELKKNGFRANASKGGGSWLEQLKYTCKDIINIQIKRKERFKRSYKKRNRHQGAITHSQMANGGAIILKGKEKLKDQFGFTMAVYIDTSGSMTSCINNVFNAAYTVTEQLKQEFGLRQEINIDEIALKSYIFTTVMKEITWGKKYSANGGTYTFDDLINDIHVQGKEAFVNIVFTDGEFSGINEDRICNILKEMEGMIILISNQPEGQFNDLIRKANVKTPKKLKAIYADSNFTLKK